MIFRPVRVFQMPRSAMISYPSTCYHGPMAFRLRNRLISYSRFVKAEHTLFSVPLIFSGAVLAGGRWPSWRLSGLILVAGFGARTAAFAMNRIIDRHIDAKNPRTANRELPKGALKLA